MASWPGRHINPWVLSLAYQTMAHRGLTEPYGHHRQAIRTMTYNHWLSGLTDAYRESIYSYTGLDSAQASVLTAVYQQLAIVADQDHVRRLEITQIYRCWSGARSCNVRSAQFGKSAQCARLAMLGTAKGRDKAISALWISGYCPHIEQQSNIGPYINGLTVCCVRYLQIGLYSCTRM
jgi:hypothetical protein